MVIARARRAGDPGSNPGPGENLFSLKLLIKLALVNKITKTDEMKVAHHQVK